ncbi:hypothetical protein [Paenibacillus hexagrammi]|uniref:Integrase catalytic domain-containing protein n=1 Tax=Paenibacillus hexagrammi TaxID=2908839 RepID=A0ABY3SI41_9BACL|nr:hypothetical protein [Paenibacillus sp. YPD9-1]UJF32904.1 hypothetical protein L0M14_25560 [Paenibacillus sp. YPD9-1]
MKSWDLHQALKMEKYEYLNGAAADYLLKMQHFTDWLRYYNSVRLVGPGKKTG